MGKANGRRGRRGTGQPPALPQLAMLPLHLPAPNCVAWRRVLEGLWGQSGGHPQAEEKPYPLGAAGQTGTGSGDSWSQVALGVAGGGPPGLLPLRVHQPRAQKPRWGSLTRLGSGLVGRARPASRKPLPPGGCCNWVPHSPWGSRNCTSPKPPAVGGVAERVSAQGPTLTAQLWDERVMQPLCTPGGVWRRDCGVEVGRWH